MHYPAAIAVVRSAAWLAGRLRWRRLACVLDCQYRSVARRRGAAAACLIDVMLLMKLRVRDRPLCIRRRAEVVVNCCGGWGRCSGRAESSCDVSVFEPIQEQFACMKPREIETQLINTTLVS